MLTGNHVLGMNYGYITSANFHRRAFVSCCIQAFSEFSDKQELTIFEAYHLLHLICPDFPRSLIEDAVAPFTSSIQSRTSSYLQNLAYSLKSIQIAIFFHVLYEEWLKIVENYFQSGHSTILDVTSQCNRFQQHIQQYYSDNRLVQPAKEIIQEVLRQISGGGRSGSASGSHATTTVYKELSYDVIRKEMYANEAIIMDVMRLPIYARIVDSVALNSGSAEGAIGDDSAGMNAMMR